MLQRSILFNHPQQTSIAIFYDEVKFTVGVQGDGNHLQWGLVLTFGGVCRYECGGKFMLLRAGDLVIVRPRTVTRWRVVKDPGRGMKKPRRSTPGWHAIYAMFEPRTHWSSLLNFEEDLPGVSRLSLAGSTLEKDARRLLKTANEAYWQSHPHRDIWASHYLEELLLHLAALGKNAEPVFDERVLRAMQFMRRHYARSLTLPEISRECHISVSQLSLLFSRQTGVAPMQFLENERLNRAADLLRFSEDSIGVISSAVGFKDPNYFARRFRARAYESPREFRQRLRSVGETKA